MPRDLDAMIAAARASARRHAGDALPALDGGPVPSGGHEDHGGWTEDRDDTPVCARGTELRSEEGTAA